MSLRNLEINGERLDASEISATTSSLRREREAAGESVSLADRLALQDEAIEILIDRTLVIQEAQKLGLVPTESDLSQALAETAKRYDGIAGCRAGADTPEVRADLRRRLTVDCVLEHWRLAVASPRADEIRSYYSKNKEQFYTPEMIHASHFVRACADGANSEAKAPEAEVNEFRRQALAGEAFASLATQRSDCPENGGDLGWFARGVMVEEFDAVVFHSPVNELTPVFRTAFGFHFALVHERRPAGIRPFSEVRRQAERTLWLMKQDREVGRRLAGLRERATVKVIR
jgi:PPIC-type PPIASE domain/SurA N-terminal domain